MKLAIISDIHANAQAWKVVSADLDTQKIDQIICLGDVVGYGPRPQEVLDLVREKTGNIILGNHDAVAGGQLQPDAFNDRARAIIEWTCDQLDDEAKHYLSSIPYVIEDPDGHMLFTHAEVCEPSSWAYIVDEEDAKRNFAACKEQVIFFGHSHHPGTFVQDKRGNVTKLDPGALHIEKGKRYLINPGSIGDPRTTDIRACYVIYDTELKSLMFRQLPFDAEGYRSDLAETGLDSKPWFLSYLDGETAHGSVDQAITKPVLVTQKPGEHTARITLQAPAAGVGSPEALAAQRQAVARAKADFAALQQRKKSGPSGALIGMLVVGGSLLAAVAGIFLLKSFLGKPNGEDRASSPIEERSHRSVDSPADAPAEVEEIVGALRPSSEAFILETSEGTAQEWEFKEGTPEGKWMTTTGTADGWRKGKGPFLGPTGQEGSTAWESDLICLRREFTLEDVPDELQMRLKVDDRADVYINGVSAARINESTQGHYLHYPIGKAASGVLKEGINLVAIRATDFGGERRQIDLGLFTPDTAKETTSAEAPQPETMAAANPAPKPATPIAPIGPTERLYYFQTSEEAPQRWKIHVGPQGPPKWRTTNSDKFTDASGILSGDNGWTDLGTILRLRKSFEVSAIPTELYLRMMMDDSTTVYLNGDKVADVNGSTQGRYVEIKLKSGAPSALKVGTNEIAVMVRNKSGNTGSIDLGLFGPSDGKITAAPEPNSGHLCELIPPSWLNHPFHWRYHLGNREDKWQTPEFDASKWRIGPGNFTNQHPKANPLITRWDTAAFYARREFDLEQIPTAIQFRFPHRGAGNWSVNGVRMYLAKTASDARWQTLDSSLLKHFKIGRNLICFNAERGKGANSVHFGVRAYFEKPGHPVTSDYPSTLKGLTSPEGDIVLRKDHHFYTRTNETTLSEANASFAAGNENQIHVGSAGQGTEVERGILFFNLEPVVDLGVTPSGKGSLVLSVEDARDIEKQSLFLYAILPENAGWRAATWDERIKGKPWKGGSGLGAKPGVGFSPKPISSAVFNGEEKVTFTIPAQYLQFWASNPKKNAGLLLLVDERKNHGISFASGQSLDVTLRPTLRFPFKSK